MDARPGVNRSEDYTAQASHYNVAQNATVSNSPATPNANAGSPNATTANPSPASPESPGISGLPETSAKSKPPATVAGKPSSGSFLLTDVRVGQDGQWRIVSSHTSQLTSPQ
jgi:hypothetical protein